MDFKSSDDESTIATTAANTIKNSDELINIIKSSDEWMVARSNGITFTRFLYDVALLGTTYLAWRGPKRAEKGFKVPHEEPHAARGPYPGGFHEGAMNRREAALILGIRENDAAEKIRVAHRRAIVANHPDAGGSNYLASEVNEAKDVLLQRFKARNSF